MPSLGKNKSSLSWPSFLLLGPYPSILTRKQRDNACHIVLLLLDITVRKWMTINQCCAVSLCNAVGLGSNKAECFACNKGGWQTSTIHNQRQTMNLVQRVHHPNTKSHKKHSPACSSTAERSPWCVRQYPAPSPGRCDRATLCWHHGQPEPAARRMPLWEGWSWRQQRTYRCSEGSAYSTLAHLGMPGSMILEGWKRVGLGIEEDGRERERKQGSGKEKQTG